VRQPKSAPLELAPVTVGEVKPAGASIARELGALALIAVAAFATVSLVSLHLMHHPNVANLGGPVGGALATHVARLFGYGAYPLIALVVMLGARIWSGANWKDLAREIGAGAIVVIAIASALGLWRPGDMVTAGMMGGQIAGVLAASLNIGGGYLAVGFTLICGIALMLKRAPTDLASAAARKLKPSMPFRSEQAIALADEFDGKENQSSSLGVDGGKTPRPSGPIPLKVRRIEPRESRDKKDKSDLKSRNRGGFKLPPLSLLDIPPAEHSQIDEVALERSARVLEQKLADFGVDGRVVEVQPGPVVTMYKFEPGSGIKVSQIVNLADDLSMALRAAAVRIQAPVPNEAVVGIEVPNRKREMIYLREILESDEFAGAQSQLTIALGKDIAGRPMATDLAKMPHLLIAGATGTGKSVSLHTMIASVLFNATADDVRFIMIDPKMLELSTYENIPHLLVPVVVDPDKAASALLWATQEMETRYTMMRDLGVRNIDGYNRALSSGAPVVELKPANQISDGVEPPIDGADAPPKIEHRKLPKIVIVIDELADLLLSEGKTVERDITRLAQKARASGIHLILATQRPSVDVITGLIKANLPARISLQVTSRVDSRTILDSIGAERLLGAGDMLFMPPGSAKLVRLHGPFVSEIETRKLADFLRAQGTPDYRMEILDTKPPTDELGEDYERDENYDEAVNIVMETGQASISMIQRRLRIGYNRAARMVEQMEREGIVSPPDGARPREVRLRKIK
jgi:DNA segregation ATPase FtsK/SpoIIIE, S-DNA-T family